LVSEFTEEFLKKSTVQQAAGACKRPKEYKVASYAKKL
jgi:hypothetical protein